MNKNNIINIGITVIVFAGITGASLFASPFHAKAWDNVRCNRNVTGIVSDANTRVGQTGYAALAWDQNPAWTAMIPRAHWIWDSYKVQNPESDQTVFFFNDLNVIGKPAFGSVTIAADNFYKLYVNGIVVGSELTNENNFALETQDTYNILPYLAEGDNIITFEVMNKGVLGSTPESNPAGLLYNMKAVGITCQAD